MNLFKKAIDNLFGTSDAPTIKERMQFFRPNRKQRRANASAALKVKAAPRRAKYEKRGAPGRASKGRRPFR